MNDTFGTKITRKRFAIDDTKMLDGCIDNRTISSRYRDIEVFEQCFHIDGCLSIEWDDTPDRTIYHPSIVWSFDISKYRDTIKYRYQTFTSIAILRYIEYRTSTNVYTNNASITQQVRFLYINGFILESCHICMESLIICLHRHVNNSTFIKPPPP